MEQDEAEFCQRCGKRAYRSASEAGYQLNLARRVTRRFSGKRPRRAYKGECGWWHLTAMPKEEGPARKRGGRRKN